MIARSEPLVDPYLTTTALSRQEALVRLLGALRDLDYSFVTVTPATHRRVLGRPEKAVARTLRDVFGWSLPFEATLLPTDITDLMAAADVIEREGALARSRVRVSSLGGDLFLHSAFPPTAEDAVFFGPDTYRFATFMRAALTDGRPVGTVVDIGTGSGAGGLVAHRLTQPSRIILTDINTTALGLAGANAAFAGAPFELREGDGLKGLSGPFDLIVANPPFIAGSGERTYRDGGDMHGARLSLDWTLAASERLSVGGRFLLYTGVAILDGRDPFKIAVHEALERKGFAISYSELDPDIFGGQLSTAAYRDAERMAAIGLLVERL